MPERFYSDKDTDTPADTLKAIGLAEVFLAWQKRLGRDDRQVTIKDRRGYYEIILPHPFIEVEDIEKIAEPFSIGRGRKLVKQPKGKGKGESTEANQITDGFSYEEQQQLKADYWKRRNALSPADLKRYLANPQAEEFAQIVGARPDPDLDLYACLNQFKVGDAYNALCLQWEVQNLKAFQANLALILEIFSQHPNATDTAVERWERLIKEGRLTGKGAVTLLQVVNAASGKGGNNPKANGLSIGNLDGFWLIEYLKFVGFFTVAAPLRISKSKDRKTYVLRPTGVEINLLHEVMEEFRKDFRPSTAVKLDILAALRFTATLVTSIQRAIKARNQRTSWRSRLNQPIKVIDISQGFDIASYKDMGSAYATMNLATINLPGWLSPIATTEDATKTLALLDEHKKVIDSIKLAKGEEGSEELELLRRYRDFLSGHDSHRFFEFAALYGDYYLAKRHRNQWASQFTTKGIKQLVAQAKEKEYLSLILDSKGFQAIARAIRHSTIIAQSYVAQDAKNHVVGNQRFPFEVRYGLGQELLRTAAYPKDFLGALDVFMHTYLAENARISERIVKESLPDNERNWRPSLKEEHIREIFQLVDTYGSEIVCKTLVAYGYARDSHTSTVAATEEQDEADQKAQEIGEDS